MSLPRNVPSENALSAKQKQNIKGHVPSFQKLLKHTLFAYFSQNETCEIKADTEQLFSSFQNLTSLKRYQESYMKFDSRVTKIMQLIAHGKQSQAERVLKQHPEILLGKSYFTDYYRTSIKKYYPFQLALNARDADMCEMILNYLPKEEAIKQLKEFKSEGIHYQTLNPKTNETIIKQEIYYSHAELGQAYKTYNDKYAAMKQSLGKEKKEWPPVRIGIGSALFEVPRWRAEECRRAWLDIGLAQRQVPTWIAQAYVQGLFPSSK